YRSMVRNGNIEDMAMEQRSESFELPALLNIGVAYDLNMNEESRFTFAGNFVSNTATQDQFQVGAEYAFMEKFMARAGFDYQEDTFSDHPSNVNTGFTAGATVEVPF